MKARIIDALKAELTARGFAPHCTAPNETMSLDDDYLSGIELADLFDTMIARREKVFRSSDVVGADVAKKSFDDVVLVIDSIKAVIGRLTLP